MAFQPPVTADAVLIRDCLAGNKIAWIELVNRFTPGIILLAHRKGLTPQDGEDVAQQTFKQVFKNLSQHDTNKSLTAWIQHIAWTFMVKLWQSRKETVPLPDDLPSMNGDMQHSLEIREALKHLRKRLAGQNEIKVFEAMMEFLRGGDVQSARDDWALAKKTGIHVGTCHTTRMRLEEKVREELSRQGLGPETHVPKMGN
jgi:DNA-directed RNA polymerase specialized sigma24 family protein